MIGILNIAGHRKELLSLSTAYSKTVCKRGYPDSLPIAHFFKVSFLTEEGDDFFADWMYGKNKDNKWHKGQWYNGTIIFYDETSYGQEFLHYELTDALATSFRVDYDQEHGMVTTLEIFARERIYDHKFIINSEYYAITFDYVKPKERSRQLLNTDPNLFELYYTDTSGKRIEKSDFKIGSFIYLNVRGENLAGKTGDLSIEDEKVDFEYEGNRLENDTLQNYTFKSNNDSIKLKIIEPKNDN